MNISEKNEIKSPMVQPSRPWPMTILCVLGFMIHIPLLFVILAYLFARELTYQGQLNLLAFIIIFFLGISGLIGYWNMRRWGVYSYGLGSLCAIVFGYFLGWDPSIQQYIILAIFIGSGLFYYKRMK